MIKILIDNQDIESVFGVQILEYADIFGFAEIRNDNLEWYDKSGIDPNLSNIRYEPRDFSLKFLVKATNIKAAKDKIGDLINYTFSHRVFVLSIRDEANNIRECFLCKRTADILPTINVRETNSLYVSTIVFTDINPNAIKYYNEIESGDTSIDYTKGTIANIYWGNGDRDMVENSGTYSKTDYEADGLVDIIIDTDIQSGTVSALTANFTADVVNGIASQIVNFTDTSTGDVTLWSWDFGDGSTSSLENPTHTYPNAGSYTVKLQVFNSVGGSATITKTNYITIRRPWLLINSTDAMLINNTDKLLKK